MRALNLIARNTKTFQMDNLPVTQIHVLDSTLLAIETKVVFKIITAVTDEEKDKATKMVLKVVAMRRAVWMSVALGKVQSVPEACAIVLETMEALSPLMRLWKTDKFKSVTLTPGGPAHRNG
jgi:hypothetical protein